MQPSENNQIFLHGLKSYPAFGPVRLMQMLKYFGHNFSKTFLASPAELLAAGIEKEHAEGWIKTRQNLDIGAEEEKLKNLGIRLLSYRENDYPKQLLEIADLPPLLYIRGKGLAADELCLAVVGTRKISTYGRTVLPEILETVCQMKVCIVSGLAFGVDALAHEIALKNNCRTIGVLGGGVDDKSIYPQNHQLLAQKILENHGSLVSEYPPGTPNLRHHFISRNRIISGLSVGCLVVECGLESGSLITAKHALEQNRTVFAVPGPVYAENSKGPNNLLKMGAKAVTESADILNELNLASLPAETENQNLFGMTANEVKIMENLSKEPVVLDQVIKTSGLSPADATSALTFLEMKGKIRNVGGQQYVRSR